jgi:lathosterol oxidase
MSGALFWLYYWRPTFETWQRKSNPQFPKPADGAARGAADAQGHLTATLCPALALHLVDSGWSKAYGGLGGYGVGYLVFTFFVAWIGSDLYEFAYHRLGHTRAFWWKQHKHHHVFFNPSPFSVIADDLRSISCSAPRRCCSSPWLMPINMDLLFLTYGAFFYGYGVYLHWGFELALARRPPPLDQHQLPALRAPREVDARTSPCTPGSSSSCGTSSLEERVPRRPRPACAPSAAIARG